MSEAGSLVNSTLQTSVPWGEVVCAPHLQTLLVAIAKRFARIDTALANHAVFVCVCCVCCDFATVGPDDNAGLPHIGDVKDDGVYL